MYKYHITILQWPQLLDRDQRLSNRIDVFEELTEACPRVAQPWKMNCRPIRSLLLSNLNVNSVMRWKDTVTTSGKQTKKKE